MVSQAPLSQRISVEKRAFYLRAPRCAADLVVKDF
jgi:hypothetical protein